MIPSWGLVLGTNQNNNSWPGFNGFRESDGCGECFQVTGPKASVRLMIIAGGGNDFASFGADDSTVPHLEVTTDVYNTVTGNQAGLGWLTIVLRKVACDFTATTIKMQILTGSDVTNVMMMFNFHVVGMQHWILVNPAGTNTWNPVARDSFNRFIYKPASTAEFPLTIQVPPPQFDRIGVVD
jgi:hypothetical protein